MDQNGKTTTERRKEVILWRRTKRGVK